MKRLSKEKQHTLQMWLGFILAVFGMVMILAGFIVPPPGIVDPTVLAAVGEVFTFSGALIGIDYHYKERKYEFLRTHGVEEREEDEGNK